MQIISLINKNDTPINFQDHFNLNAVNIDYINLMEINQGSPLVGNFLINKKNIFKNIFFGGPFLYDNENDLIYIPVFIRKFCVVGFRLSRIDLKNNSISYLGKLEPLFFLKEIKDSKIYFYRDVMKSKESFIEINN